MKNVSLVVLIALIAASCATKPMTKRECEAGDWNKQGFDDAVHGVSKEAFEKHAKACKEFGFKVDEDLYERGFQKGLESACTYSRGFKLGLEGRSYNGNCIGEMEPEYRRGYKEGMKQREMDEKADQDASKGSL